MFGQGFFYLLVINLSTFSIDHLFCVVNIIEIGQLGAKVFFIFCASANTSLCIFLKIEPEIMFYFWAEIISLKA